MERLMELIKKLKESKKPDVRFIETQKVEELKDSDCLSEMGTIFRNGGSIDGVRATPFIEVTQELRELLQEIFA